MARDAAKLPRLSDERVGEILRNMAGREEFFDTASDLPWPKAIIRSESGRLEQRGLELYHGDAPEGWAGTALNLERQLRAAVKAEGLVIRDSRELLLPAAVYAARLKNGVRRICQWAALGIGGGPSGYYVRVDALVERA